MKIDEIKEELSDTMNLENDKKMTPIKIKEELDKYIIGQEHVKKALAVSLRNFFYFRNVIFIKLKSIKFSMIIFKRHL